MPRAIASISDFAGMSALSTANGIAGSAATNRAKVAESVAGLAGNFPDAHPGGVELRTRARQISKATSWGAGWPFARERNPSFGSTGKPSLSNRVRLGRESIVTVNAVDGGGSTFVRTESCVPAHVTLTIVTAGGRGAERLPATHNSRRPFTGDCGDKYSTAVGYFAWFSLAAMVAA